MNGSTITRREDVLFEYGFEGFSVIDEAGQILKLNEIFNCIDSWQGLILFVIFCQYVTNC